MSDLYHQLKQFGRVKLNESLAKHTTFKIGGRASFFVVVDDIAKLTKLLSFLSNEGVEYYILGGGSNLLFGDEDYDGVIINIQYSIFNILPDNIIEASAGALLSKVLDLTMQNSLSGLEWAAGVPGTIGGAVRGNAGAMGHDIGEVVEKVEVWRNGEIVELNNTECEFAYRESIFKKNSDVILRVWLKLKPGGKAEILKTVQGYLKQRTGAYPNFPSAGSFFKNLNLKDWPGDIKDLPELFRQRGKVPAGWLVEQVNLKGFAVGGAKVSDEHGNFIINFKEATQSDILQLVEIVKEKVYNKFKVELEPEVEIIK